MHREPAIAKSFKESKHLPSPLTIADLAVFEGMSHKIAKKIATSWSHQVKNGHILNLRAIVNIDTTESEFCKNETGNIHRVSF